jgi:hypothetical protein
MEEHLKRDSVNIGHLLNIIKEQGTQYLNSIEERPTSVMNISVSEKQELPEFGYGTEEALRIFNEKFEPIMVGSGGPILGICNRRCHSSVCCRRLAGHSL